MSEIESLGRMRDELQICKNAHRRPTIEFMELCADEIEAEIERKIDERYIESPVDGNGNVVGIGDQLMRKGKDYIVNALVWNGRVWFFTETIVSPAWIPTKKAVLFRRRTLEDVLEEFADAAADVDERDLEEWVPLLAKYADEIRKMKAK